MPCGWFEGPHGAFRANPAFKMEWPPQSLKWQAPVYLHAQPQPKHTASEFTNELGNAIRITIEGPTSTSENVLTPMEAAKLRGALNEHATQAPAPVAGRFVSADTLARLVESPEGTDLNQPGSYYRNGWNAALRLAMGYAQPLSVSPTVVAGPAPSPRPNPPPGRIVRENQAPPKPPVQGTGDSNG